MTKKVIETTEDQVEAITLREQNNGFRMLHWDFIGSKHRLTFVNGTDDPTNDPAPPLRNQTDRQMLDEIAGERNVNLV